VCPGRDLVSRGPHAMILGMLLDPKRHVLPRRGFDFPTQYCAVTPRLKEQPPIYSSACGRRQRLVSGGGRIARLLSRRGGKSRPLGFVFTTSWVIKRGVLRVLFVHRVFIRDQGRDSAHRRPHTMIPGIFLDPKCHVLPLRILIDHPSWGDTGREN
jgi:hypothetical protein